jgi:hypothetical protein
MQILFKLFFLIQIYQTRKLQLPCHQHILLKKNKILKLKLQGFRAKDEARTRDNQLGRLELYQLSYFRITVVQI